MTTNSSPHHDISGPEAFQAAFNVSRETIERIEIFAGLLRDWQKTINLVAPSTLDHLWHRHFADSAQLATHVPETAETFLDLGSGAGFPGLVLAMLVTDAARPHPLTAFRLVESDARKAAFLREVARQTDLPVDILCGRIEKFAIQDRFDSDVITARALAPLDRLLPLISPFFSVKSKALLLKGRNAASEIEAAEENWRMVCELVPSLTDRDARLIVISDLQAKSEG